MPVGIGLLEDFEANRDALDVRAAAARVAVPWLILHGTDDLTVWPGEAETLTRASRSAHLRRVDQAGHTFEVGHPFHSPSLQLQEVFDHSLEHFRKHLEP